MLAIEFGSGTDMDTVRDLVSGIAGYVVHVTEQGDGGTPSQSMDAVLRGVDTFNNGDCALMFDEWDNTKAEKTGYGFAVDPFGDVKIHIY